MLLSKLWSWWNSISFLYELYFVKPSISGSCPAGIGGIGRLELLALLLTLFDACLRFSLLDVCIFVVQFTISLGGANCSPFLIRVAPSSISLGTTVLWTMLLGATLGTGTRKPFLVWFRVTPSSISLATIVLCTTLCVAGSRLWSCTAFSIWRTDAPLMKADRWSFATSGLTLWRWDFRYFASIRSSSENYRRHFWHERFLQIKSNLWVWPGSNDSEMRTATSIDIKGCEMFVTFFDKVWIPILPK